MSNRNVDRVNPPLTQDNLEHLDAVSHDFRSLLNIIVGFSELMLDEVTGKINEAQRQSLKDILVSALRLQELVNEAIEKAEKARHVNPWAGGVPECS